AYSEIPTPKPPCRCAGSLAARMAESLGREARVTQRELQASDALRPVGEGGLALEFGPLKGRVFAALPARHAEADAAESGRALEARIARHVAHIDEFQAHFLRRQRRDTETMRVGIE